VTLLLTSSWCSPCSRVCSCAAASSSAPTQGQKLPRAAWYPPGQQLVSASSSSPLRVSTSSCTWAWPGKGWVWAAAATLDTLLGAVTLPWMHKVLPPVHALTQVTCTSPEAAASLAALHAAGSDSRLTVDRPARRQQQGGEERASTSARHVKHTRISGEERSSHQTHMCLETLSYTWLACHRPSNHLCSASSWCQVFHARMLHHRSGLHQVYVPQRAEARQPERDVLAKASEPLR
jgi:hypothetical protein